MFYFSLSTSVILLASAEVYAAPTLSASGLLLNGVQSINLNNVFNTFNATDPCRSGDIACVDGAIADCVSGAWKLEPCRDSQQCFVLPSLQQLGTFIACTSLRNAFSIIKSTGLGDLIPAPGRGRSPNGSSRGDPEASVEPLPDATPADLPTGAVASEALSTSTETPTFTIPGAVLTTVTVTLDSPFETALQSRTPTIPGQLCTAGLVSDALVTARELNELPAAPVATA